MTDSQFGNMMVILLIVVIISCVISRKREVGTIEDYEQGLGL